MAQSQTLLSVLGPMIKQRMAALESGKAVPGQPVGASATTGGLPVSMYQMALPTATQAAGMNANQFRNATISSTTPEVNDLIASVKGITGGTVPGQSEHHSILGKIFSAIEKPYHGVVGAVSEQGNWAAHHDGENWLQRIGGNAEAIGKGFVKGFDNKEKAKSFSDLRDQFTGKDYKHVGPAILRNDPLSHNKIGRFAESFLGDVALDPLTYTGTGSITKVKTLARGIEDLTKAEDVAGNLIKSGVIKPAQKHSVIATLMGKPSIQEGKWYTKRQLLNSEQKAHAMDVARMLAGNHADTTWAQHVAEHEPIAIQELLDKRIMKYKNVKDFRFGRRNELLGEPELKKWNDWVDHQTKSRTLELAGDPKEFKKAAASTVLDLAARNNLIGDVGKASDTLQKGIALRFAGKDVLKAPLPKSINNSIAKLEAVKGLKEFSAGIHDHWNTLFRTGSHIDPMVNAMRLSGHSSMVDKMNAHIQDIHSIWGRVSKADRAAVAHAATQEQSHVIIPGGRSFDKGTETPDLVAHVTDQVKHMEKFIGNGPGQVTFNELMRQLPKNFRLPKDFADERNPLLAGWRDHYLHPSAHYALRTFGNDPAMFVPLMQRAIFSALADKEMPEQLIKRFGINMFPRRAITPKGGTVMGPADNIASLLHDEHGYRTPMRMNDRRQLEPIKPYEGHIFHPDVAKGIESMHALIDHEAGNFGLSSSTVGRLFNNVTTIFKTAVTKYNPGFHERNLLGEAMQSLADGVTSVRPYRQAMKVLRRHGTHELDTGVERKVLNWRGHEVPDARVHNAIRSDSYARARAVGPQHKSNIVITKKFRDLRSGQVTADQIWHAYVANGLKTGWISTETGKYTGRALGRLGAAANEGTQRLTENIEDYARLAHFISRIERSKSTDFVRAAEEAAGYVRKYHFDYTDFTPFERNTASKVIPFYKWTRKNIPLQLSLLAQKPGYFLTQMKALNAASNAQGYHNNGNLIPQADEIMPQWLRDHLAVPVGAGSSGTRYLDAPLPALQAQQFFGAGPKDLLSNIMYMTNPIGKVPAELQTGKTFGGPPITSKAQYFEQMTPYTNLIRNLTNSGNTGKATNLWQFLLGAGLVENTPARQKSELKRVQTQVAAARKKFRASHNMAPLG